MYALEKNHVTVPHTQTQVQTGTFRPIVVFTAFLNFKNTNYVCRNAYSCKLLSLTIIIMILAMKGQLDHARL
jgi:hypothetical protein